MAFSTGMMRERVTILLPTRVTGQTGARGGWTAGPTVWASVSWAKGARALMQGELTAYESVMVRTRYNEALTRACRLRWKGRFFVIDSLNADFKENTMQVTATEVAGFEIDD